MLNGRSYHKKNIIWAITIAVVAGVTKAVTTATKNAMSKSLQGKLESSGIDPENPDQELMGQLIDVNVIRRGAYFVTVQENVYGNFSASFTARNKADAIRSLGKKVFGFVNVNKDRLTKEETDFYMTIWFETFAKDSLETKLSNLKSKAANVNNEVNNFDYRIEQYRTSIEASKAKIEKFESKIQLGKKPSKFQPKIDLLITKIENDNKEIEQELSDKKVTQEEYISIKEKMFDIKKSIEEPVFINDGKTLGLKGLVQQGKLTIIYK